MIEVLRVGIVSLGEAGNLGDDLILIAAAEAIYEAREDAQVTFLSSGQQLDLDALASSRHWPSTPTRAVRRAELPLLRDNSAIYRNYDAIVFGGGGLFQTSHAPDAPYSWLSYLPSGPASPVVLGVGLGFGPLSERWIERLKALASPFDELWVRDPESQKLALGLGWDAQVCHDFIDSTFLDTFKLAPVAETTEKVLGVALRAWPGLEVAEVAGTVRRLAREHACARAHYFVLESIDGGGIDMTFSRSVAAMSEVPFEVIPYRADQISQFMSAMAAVNVAVSMKLHSSAIWAACGVPMYPIYYAPKVASFFGANYSGLEISSQVREPVLGTEPYPRASAVVREGLSRLLSNRPRELVGRFPRVTRIWYQVRWLSWAVGMKLRRYISGR